MATVEAAEATSFLTSLLGKTFQVTVPDGRLFTGTFRCTDNESNIILSNSFEYRMPSMLAEQKARREASLSEKAVVKANMTSRFVGLIVIPGHQIVSMEVEERRLPTSAMGSSLSLRTRG